MPAGLAFGAVVLGPGVGLEVSAVSTVGTGCRLTALMAIDGSNGADWALAFGAAIS